MLGLYSDTVMHWSGKHSMHYNLPMSADIKITDLNVEYSIIQVFIASWKKFGISQPEMMFENCCTLKTTG